MKTKIANVDDATLLTIAEWTGLTDLQRNRVCTKIIDTTQKDLMLKRERVNPVTFTIVEKNKKPIITMTGIAFSFCHHSGMSFNEVSKRSRKRELVEMRQMIMYFIKKHEALFGNPSLSVIGTCINPSDPHDHSSCLYSIRKFGELLTFDKFVQNRYSTVEKSVKNDFGIE